MKISINIEQPDEYFFEFFIAVGFWGFGPQKPQNPAPNIWELLNLNGDIKWLGLIHLANPKQVEQ